jgi:hypothetical protein
MKRSFSSVFGENRDEGYEPGDEAAHIAAAALAQRLDAPTIRAITDMATLLETVGGQFYITPLRVQDDFDPGAYNVEALVFNYETRDIKVQRLEPPQEIQGLPVTESHKAGITIEIERPEIEPSSEEPDEQPEAEALEQPEDKREPAEV